MKILHLDDHSLFAQALEILLNERWPELGYLIATDINQARDRVLKHQDIGLVLLDLALPKGNGVHFMRFLRAQQRAIPVVVLTAETRAVEIKPAIDAGAMGYIPKTYTRDELLAAIGLVLQGLPSFPQGFDQEMHRLTGQASQRNTQGRLALAMRYSLSMKQLDVLDLMSEGLSNAEIAQQLGVSENGVKYHLKVLFQSFDVSNRVQCIAYAKSVQLLAD